MKKQILKTCVAAALCLGGMSQALAVDAGGNGNLRVGAVVMNGGCDLDIQHRAIELQREVADFGVAVGDRAGAEQDIVITTQGGQCGNLNTNVDARLTITGTAAAANYFQLRDNQNAPIANHGVSLMLGAAPVVPNVPLALENNNGVVHNAVNGSNTITLRAGLVRTAAGAITPGASTADLLATVTYR
ncbi:hypothetical protein C6H65_05870 [Photorhabdus luminescens]|nr:hypothetical protein C6H65_05870 [Photorhabdus luminescens]